ncbi:hypothetical protein LTR62_004813 [Meristemomyces frigidus]|uniref:Srp40 C-terminal domain-containing protein n=1 Tax=Meristemomyces frigidus TaxID=1508187 RepID=A0AAN7TE26_9PEZI|nr:hypothetical protein LTR62_004813 [Meristemomyces frigidus]
MVKGTPPPLPLGTLLAQLEQHLDQIPDRKTLNATLKDVQKKGSSGLSDLAVIDLWSSRKQQTQEKPATKDQIVAKVEKKSAERKKKESSDSSSSKEDSSDESADAESDSSSDDEKVEEAKVAAVSTKRKREATPESSSSEESSEEDSSSASDESAPAAKRTKMEERPVAEDVDSSDDSSSSDSEDDMEVDSSDNSTSDSESDSDSDSSDSDEESDSAESDGSSDSDSSSSSSSESDSDTKSKTMPKHKATGPLNAIPSKGAKESKNAAPSKVEEPTKKAKKAKPSLPPKSESNSSAASSVTLQPDSPVKEETLLIPTSALATLDSSTSTPPEEESGIHPDRLKRLPASFAPTPTNTNATTTIPATQQNLDKLKKQNVPFSRIPKDTYVDPKFADNSYVSYDYADRAHRDLIVTKGKGFTKEKNKKKRGAYRGGAIDFTPKGIKFED